MDPQGLSSHSNERARSMRPWVAATVAELPPPLSLAMYPPYPQQNYQTSSTQGWGVTGDPGAPFMMMDGHYQAIQNPPQLHLDTVDSAFSTQIPSLGINMNGFGAGGLPLGRSQGLGLSREPSLTGFEQSPALSRGPSFPGSDRSFALSRGSSFTGVDSRLGFEGMNGAGHGNYLQILPHDQHSLQTYGESHAGDLFADAS
ncbi:uncharacterized protein N7483_011342 [Penicillium malachiteum]|uniref:uncharacterized protein n=1 Tax=Penicillium malachiteum TaxID=1324776 RepID=UPI0025480B29|nr:uncharacterized protein N7483_011342 [Penicillium malachiteum]KAJ5714161.1 hypothetical protein N7483_011342 [Penicillium malachiteum]